MKVARDDSNCTIMVEDDGIGISPEALEKLGTKNATFGKLNGSGLGLYGSSLNLKRWGGSITGERLTRGTRFTVKVPLLQTGVTFTGLPAGLKLEVIDDDPLTAEVLKMSGYDVLKAASSYEAGSDLLTETRAPDVMVIVDQRLDQGKLGSDLIADQPSRKNIILCTNDFDDLDVIRRAKAVGIKIIPKPLCFYPRRDRQISQPNFDLDETQRISGRP